MAIIDYYNAAVAIDQAGRLVREAKAKVYALADTTFSNPLPITDLQGVPLTQLEGNADGIYPAFRVATGEMQVVVKSGNALTPMTSLAVYANAAEAAASMASGSAGAADMSADAAALSATSADGARAAAVVAKDAAVAVGNTNDTIIEGRIKATGSKTELALRDKIDALAKPIAAAAAGPVLHGRWVFDGSSSVAGAVVMVGDNQNRGATWVNEFVRLSGGRIDYVFNAAVGGQNLAAALARFDAQVATKSPDTVFLAIGNNDLAGGRSLASFLADLDTYYAKVLALGARLALGSIYPRTADAATIVTWNRALVAWAAARNIPVVPFWRLADPTTGGWPAAWTTDDIHLTSTAAGIAAAGALAWSTLAPSIVGGAANLSAMFQTGLLSNGFFTALAAGNAATVTSASSSATTGSLPAGAYEYRIAVGNYWGKSGSFADTSITLASAGGVTITRASSGTFNRWVVFRKGPGDAKFRYMTELAGGATTTWTDDGTIAPGYDWIAGDFSVAPTGISLGATQMHSQEFGSPLFTEPGIRGNVLRVAQYNAKGTTVGDYVTSGPVSAGQTLEFACKYRSPGVTGQAPILRLRPVAGGTVINTIDVVRQFLGNQWGDVHYRFVVPATADAIRIYVGGDPAYGYCDIAEMYLGQIP